MESLPKGPILEYNPNTLEQVRREINLDKPGRINEALDILEDWVKKQSHFIKKEYPRDYLERTLVSTKGLVERAKTRIDRLCTFRTLMPNFFTCTEVDNIYLNMKNLITHAHLPKLTSDNYRVYVFKLLIEDGDSQLIFNYYKYTIILSEYVKRYDYCNGFILVMDFTEANIMNFVTKLNVVELRQALTIMMEGYGMRVKGMHFITPSKMVDALVSIFKSVLSEKLGKRIYIHKTVETLYEYVSRDILPMEYGGTQKSLKSLNEEWYKVISSKQHIEYLQEMKQAKTDESFRQSDKFNENYIDMPGSFRSLSVD